MIKKIEMHGAIIEVSDDGRVFSPESISSNGKRLTRREKKQSIVNGYSYVNLYNPKTRKQRSESVHRIMAKAFLVEWNPDLCVDHIDGCKANNKIKNLRIVPRGDNTRIYWDEQRTLMKNRKGRPDFFVGVSKSKKNRFIAQIRVGNQRISGGMFANRIDAACAANKIMLSAGYPLSRINTPLAAIRLTSFESSNMRLSRSFCYDIFN